MAWGAFRVRREQRLQGIITTYAVTVAAWVDWRRRMYRTRRALLASFWMRGHRWRRSGAWGDQRQREFGLLVASDQRDRYQADADDPEDLQAPWTTRTSLCSLHQVSMADWNNARKVRRLGCIAPGELCGVRARSVRRALCADAARLRRTRADGSTYDAGWSDADDREARGSRRRDAGGRVRR